MAGFNPYTTTTKSTAESAVGEVVKREIMLPMSEGGQPPSCGRKAKGDFCESFNKAHNNIGLRK